MLSMRGADSCSRHDLQCPAATHVVRHHSRCSSSLRGRAHRLTTLAAPVAVSTEHHRAKADVQDSSSSSRLQEGLDAVRSNGEGPSTSGRQQHIAVFRANKAATMPLREGQRPLGVSISSDVSSRAVNYALLSAHINVLHVESMPGPVLLMQCMQPECLHTSGCSGVHAASS